MTPPPFPVAGRPDRFRDPNHRIPGSGLRILVRTAFLAAIAIALVGTAVAGDPPDLEFNTATGYVEAVEKAADSGLIRHVVDRGQGKGTAVAISESPGEDPRIAIKTTGESWVVWWRGGASAEVLFSRRSGDGEADTWTAEARISMPGEDSRNPEIVHDGTATWVAYEITTASTTSIAVTGVIDSPEPFPSRTLIDTCSYSGDVDVQAHSDGGRVWITWVASVTQVGWSRYDAAAGNWTVPAYVSYAGSDPEAGRRAARTAVFAP